MTSRFPDDFDFVEMAKKASEVIEEKEKKKHQPPESPTGKCVHCSGLVTGAYSYKMNRNVDRRNVPIGPGSSAHYSWHFEGFHCTGCGLCYKFPPPGE